MVAIAFPSLNVNTQQLLFYWLRGFISSHSGMLSLFSSNVELNHQYHYHHTVCCKIT